VARPIAGASKERVAEADLALGRVLLHAVHRGVADVARRDVDDPLEVDVAGGVDQEAQVRQEIFDLSALEEAQAAVHGITHAVVAEHLLDDPRLGVGAVKNGDLRGRGVVVAGEVVLDRADDGAGLLDLVVERDDLDGGAVAEL
jgi:hypothetical protein